MELSSLKTSVYSKVSEEVMLDTGERAEQRPKLKQKELKKRVSKELRIEKLVQKSTKKLRNLTH